ncbi:alpha/beta fold hydrolase [Spirillospora sp. CA-253888]
MSVSARGRAPVNGLSLYYEVHGETHGEGRPLLLLHGGLHTIDLSFGALLPGLAAGHRAIAVEMQGHGRTPDIDRPPTPENLAGDMVALLDHLGVGRADVFGFSLGGLVALQMAIDAPERVGRVVMASAPCAPDGFHTEVRGPGARPGVGRMPAERDFQDMHDAYRRLAPDPEHFGEFAARQSEAVLAFEGWGPDRLRAVSVPVLLLIGDRDFVRVDHAEEVRALIPKASLAVLPDTDHMAVTRRTDLLLPMLRAFLR